MDVFSVFIGADDPVENGTVTVRADRVVRPYKPFVVPVAYGGSRVARHMVNDAWGPASSTARPTKGSLVK